MGTPALGVVSLQQSSWSLGVSSGTLGEKERGGEGEEGERGRGEGSRVLLLYFSSSANTRHLYTSQLFR